LTKFLSLIYGCYSPPVHWLLKLKHLV